MDNWGVVAGLGLIAATAAVVAFTRSRERETERLRRGADLARDLRERADGDVVRLAAVDEYEITLYQRLFYVSTISPRIGSAVWALLGAVLAAASALATRGDGVLTTIVASASIVVAVLFTSAALGFLGLALIHLATTPRVSFAQSYDA
ncbi:MAG: histidine kinase, partial [Gordonia sp. (in: high G+C Gram-positive bacteria)]